MYFFLQYSQTSYLMKSQKGILLCIFLKNWLWEKFFRILILFVSLYHQIEEPLKSRRRWRTLNVVIFFIFFNWVYKSWWHMKQICLKKYIYIWVKHSWVWKYSQKLMLKSHLYNNLMSAVIHWPLQWTRCFKSYCV